MQRAIIPLQAQLTLGDSSAPADVFDSMPFRGVQLASDDDMLPDSLKGYAPVVCGIARTNAQVVVRQNGYQIYQSYVAPGAFEIADMYPTGGAGDLDVTIVEADGSEQHFTLPYASLPVLQREGRLKYALTAGQYRSYNRSVEKTPFGQLTGIYGLPHGITLYGGVRGQISTSRRLWGWARTWAIRGSIRRRHPGLVNAGAYRENKRSVVAGQIQQEFYHYRNQVFDCRVSLLDPRLLRDAGRPRFVRRQQRASGQAT